MEGGIAALVGPLRSEEPAQGKLRMAAVSVVISPEVAPSVLLIRRAEHQGDPWSGQIAFPGGKMQPGDGSAKGTAVRETLEEAGFDLDEGGNFLGYGASTVTHTGTMQVVPAVFSVERRPLVALNGEATSFKWVSLQDLRSPEAKSTYRLKRGDYVEEMPAYGVGEYVVWGLTYRILRGLLEAEASR